MIKNHREYRPDIAIHPGETLQENLESLGMSQIELSLRTGLTPKTVSEIVKGKSSITPSTALKFEKALGISARFWNNLQINYEETLARLEKDKQMEREYAFAKRFTCYPELAKFGFVKPISPNAIHEKTLNLLKFFAIDSFEYLQRVQQVAFRIDHNKTISSENLAAWLRCGEIQAEKVSTREFSTEKIREQIPLLRNLTQNPSGFTKTLRAVCADAGIAVVFTPCLLKTRVNGATMWKAGKAVIQLSDRWKMSDVFWFTFFHELGHILKHGKKEVFIELQNDFSSDYENEANEFAANTLIPIIPYSKFLESENLSDSAISVFAESIGVGREIVAGRLAKDGHIPWPRIQHLRTSIEIMRGYSD